MSLGDAQPVAWIPSGLAAKGRRRRARRTEPDALAPLPSQAASDPPSQLPSDPPSQLPSDPPSQLPSDPPFPANQATQDLPNGMAPSPTPVVPNRTERDPAHPSPQAQGRSRLLAWFGLWGAGEFVLAILALHVAAFSDQPTYLSEYVHGDYPWLWVAAAYSVALAGLLLALALKPHVSRSPWTRAGLGLMVLAGITGLLVAIFPVDRPHTGVSLAGTIHNDAALPTFALSAAAMLLLVPDLRTRREWRRFAAATLVIGVLLSVTWIGFIYTLTHRMPAVAYMQRAMAAFIAAWLVMLALRLLSLRSAVASSLALRPPGSATPAQLYAKPKAALSDVPPMAPLGAPDTPRRTARLPRALTSRPPRPLPSGASLVGRTSGRPAPRRRPAAIGTQLPPAVALRLAPRAPAHDARGAAPATPDAGARATATVRARRVPVRPRPAASSRPRVPEAPIRAMGALPVMPGRR